MLTLSSAASEGEHVTVYGYEREAADACAGSFAAIERQNASAIEFFGLADNLHYNYRWMSPAIWAGEPDLVVNPSGTTSLEVRVDCAADERTFGPLRGRAHRLRRRGRGPLLDGLLVVYGKVDKPVTYTVEFSRL